jgi:hypothetical protein
MTMKTSGIVAAALVALTPVAAWACPACATRQGYGPGTLLLVGGLIVTPYAVTAVALKIIRRLARDGAG